LNVEHDRDIKKIQDYKANIESEKSRLEQRILKFQEEGNRASEAFNRTLDHSKTKVLSEIRSLKQVIDRLTESLEDYKTKTLESDKEVLQDRLENLLGELTSGVNELKNELTKLSTKQEEDISKIYSRMPDRLSTGLTDIYASQRDQINQFEVQIFSRVEELMREILGIVEKEKTYQQEFTNSIYSSIHESLNDFQQKIRKLANIKEKEINKIFHETNTKSISRIEIAKEDFKSGIDGATNTLDETSELQKSINKELQIKIGNHLDESRSELRKRIEKLQIEIIEDWKSRRNEQLEGLKSNQDSTLDKYRKDLTINELSHSKLLSDLEHQFRSNLYTGIDNISLTFTQFQDSFIDKINDVITRLTNFRNEMKENLDILLISNLKKIGEIGKQTEEYLPEVLEKVSDEYEISRKNTFTDLSKTVKERYGTINKYIDQFDKTLDTKMKKLVADLDIYLINFSKIIEQHTEDSIDNNISTLDQFRKNIVESFNVLEDGQDKNLQKSFHDLQNILRSEQTELITAISSLESMAEEHADKHGLAIDEKKEKSSKIRDTTFNDREKEIRTLEKDAKGIIRNIIETSHHELDENVKGSDGRIEGLVDGLGDEHKNKVSEFRSKASQEIDHKQHMLDDYISTLNDRFITFFDEQLQTLEHFISDSRSKRKTVDTIRDNLDNKIEEVNSYIESATATLHDNFNINSQAIVTSANQVVRSIDELLKTLK
jgi:hypothetical protein